jgi:hypothetical protein
VVRPQALSLTRRLLEIQKRGLFPEASLHFFGRKWLYQYGFVPITLDSLRLCSMLFVRHSSVATASVAQGAPVTVTLRLAAVVAMNPGMAPETIVVPVANGLNATPPVATLAGEES